MTGIALVFVDGADSAEYDREALTGTLDPGSFVVVAGDAQNGAPDGLALIDTDDGALLDALSYEGVSPERSSREGRTASLEGTMLSADVADSNSTAGSLSRIPDGADTNDAACRLGLHDDPDARGRQRGDGTSPRESRGGRSRRPPASPQAAASRMRRATLVQLQSSTLASLAAARSAPAPRDPARAAPGAVRSSAESPLAKAAAAERRRIVALEPLRDLGEAGVVGDDRRAAGRGGLGGDHPECLREDRRHDGRVGEREQMHEVPVLERAREEDVEAVGQSLELAR